MVLVELVVFAALFEAVDGTAELFDDPKFLHHSRILFASMDVVKASSSSDPDSPKFS